MSEFIWLLIGTFVGSIITFIVLALLIAGKENEDLDVNIDFKKQ